MFDEFDQERYFRRMWDAIQVARPVHYALFTFGESLLPYFLVSEAGEEEVTVSITKGEVKIDRPLIVTADNARPEFQNFFDNAEEEGIVDFLLARSAAFSHLKFANRSGPQKIVSDSVEEAVARLNRQLDDEEEDRTAILIAPAELRGVAVLKYTAERVWSSAADNVQELRERGFLPGS